MVSAAPVLASAARPGLAETAGIANRCRQPRSARLEIRARSITVFAGSRLLQELQQQAAHLFRLLLLAPSARSVHQVAAQQYAWHAAFCIFSKSAGLLVDAQSLFPAMKQEGVVDRAPGVRLQLGGIPAAGRAAIPLQPALDPSARTRRCTRKVAVRQHLHAAISAADGISAATVSAIPGASPSRSSGQFCQLGGAP